MAVAFDSEPCLYLFRSLISSHSLFTHLGCDDLDPHVPVSYDESLFVHNLGFDDEGPRVWVTSPAWVVLRGAHTL